MDIERLKELQIAKQVLMLNKAVVEYDLATSKDDQDFIKAVETAITLIDAEIARQSVKSEDVAEAIEWMREERVYAEYDQHDHKAFYIVGNWKPLPEPPKGE